MPLDLNNARQRLHEFDFVRLFTEELGWSQPSSCQPTPFTCKEASFTRQEVAELAAVAVFEVAAADGAIPDAKMRAAVHKTISAHHHENLLIFVDARRTTTLWYWAKRQEGKTLPREHIYVRGQPGDLFLSKLNGIVFDISEFDEAGNVPLLAVADRLKQALDVERVTQRFYAEFEEQRLAFLELIQGIGDERDRRWYASVLLNRLMFIYFLQRKFFLDGGDGRYLQNKLDQSRQHGRDLYYDRFLKALFFEGFAKPEDNRADRVNALLGKIKYLNGGLFLPHPIEGRWPKIAVPDMAFENLFALFERYSWNLNDTPGGEHNEINPDVLGYIFEKYINQKAFGAYYTRPEITEYLCERTIHRLILDGVNGSGTGVPPVSSRDHGQDAHATTGFSALAPVSIRQGAYLPHWTQEGATYAVNFRLIDSLPAEVLKQWIAERDDIVKTARQMGRELSDAELDRLEQLHSGKVEKWLDAGHGACWLKDPRIAQTVADALMHFDGPRYVLVAWCVMPNHVHAVFRPKSGHELPDTAMKPILKDVDHEPLASDADMPRWRNSAQWARNSMRQDGLLKDDSPHGTWEITAAGKERLKQGK